MKKKRRKMLYGARNFEPFLSTRRNLSCIESPKIFSAQYRKVSFLYGARNYFQFEPFSKISSPYACPLFQKSPFKKKYSKLEKISKTMPPPLGVTFHFLLKFFLFRPNFFKSSENFFK